MFNKRHHYYCFGLLGLCAFALTLTIYLNTGELNWIETDAIASTRAGGNPLQLNEPKLPVRNFEWQAWKGPQLFGQYAKIEGLRDDLDDWGKLKLREMHINPYHSKLEGWTDSIDATLYLFSDTRTGATYFGEVSDTIEELGITIVKDKLVQEEKNGVQIQLPHVIVYDHETEKEMELVAGEETVLGWHLQCATGGCTLEFNDKERSVDVGNTRYEIVETDWENHEVTIAIKEVSSGELTDQITFTRDDIDES